MARGFSSVRISEAALPPDVLTAVLAGALDGLTPSAYGLQGASPREAAARAWQALLPAYHRFRERLADAEDRDVATGLTRERWLLPLLAELEYAGISTTPAGSMDVDDRPFPVSHQYGASPVHLLGWRVPLDRRSPGVAGAARAPHAMVQELLNRTDAHLWAVVSNGRTLRLLRDSTTLTGTAFVEFDLETIFDGELFSDFVLLYLLAHASRVDVPRGDSATDLLARAMAYRSRCRRHAGARAAPRRRASSAGHAGHGLPAAPAQRRAAGAPGVRAAALGRLPRHAPAPGLPAAVLDGGGGPRRAARANPRPGAPAALRRPLLVGPTARAGAPAARQRA